MKNFILDLFGAKNILGIDIGSFNIKIVQLKNTKENKWLLVNWGLIPLPDEVFSPELNEEDKKRIIASLIKSYINERKIKTKNVAVSVSGSSVIVRFVKFPKITKEELSKSIQFEAEPYIPFDIKEVNLSFFILDEEIVEEGQKKTEVVLIAAKKDIIKDRIDIIEYAGLRPLIIDVDAFALEASYELIRDPQNPETVIIINIGASVTNINIIENNVSRIVRDILYGGNTFNRALQKNLGCDLKTSEELKKRYGLIFTPEDKEKALAENNKEALQISNILVPVSRDLLSEIHKSIDFYYSQKGEQQTISRAIISGGGACMKNIDKFFSQELKLPVDIFNPFEKIEGSNIIEPRQYLPFFSIATGLATRKYKDTQ